MSRELDPGILLTSNYVLSSGFAVVVDVSDGQTTKTRRVYSGIIPRIEVADAIPQIIRF